MKIVHFSKTPLAGAPIRLVKAINNHTKHKAYLVDLLKWNMFDHDLVFKKDKEKVIELVKKADVIHLHNYLDYNSKDFHPIDFNELRKKGKKFVRQFHSDPSLVAQNIGISVNDVIHSEIPSLAVAQFQERLYPDALVVPNIIAINSDYYTKKTKGFSWDIFYAPSNDRQIFLNEKDFNVRWGSKGMPETMFMLNNLERRTGCAIKIVTKMPFKKMMKIKKKSSLIIDELCTGSYHLSSLEGLALGRPVLSYLDNRTIYVLQEISGTVNIPMINTRLEDASKILMYLLDHPDEADEIGAYNRKWIEKYWDDKNLVQHYINAYNQLLDDPTKVTRQRELRIDNKVALFHAKTLNDLVFSARARNYRKRASLYNLIFIKSKRFTLKKIISRFNETIKKTGLSNTRKKTVKKRANSAQK